MIKIQVINKLSIKKEDAQLYANLKKDRHVASYFTNTLFSKKLIEKYK